MSTMITTVEIEEYAQAVREAMSDLDPDVVDELLDDLPEHLAEVLAELPGDGTLRSRLGQPEAYAADLRAAAGVDERSAGGPARVELFVRSVRSAAERFDVRVGRALGYPRAAELVRAVRPGWWVVRGWLLAQLASGVRGSGSWHGFVPQLGGSKATGAVLLVVAVVASVWLGRRSRLFSVWPRRLLFAGGVALAAWAIAVVPTAAAGSAYFYDNSGDVTPADSIGTTGDVYVYDQQGHLVPNARLYDQDGNALQLGSPECPDGSLAASTQNDGIDPSQVPAWTYPLCASAPGPFRSGPGPLVTPTPTPSGANASAPATIAPPASPTRR